LQQRDGEIPRARVEDEPIRPGMSEDGMVTPDTAGGSPFSHRPITDRDLRIRGRGVRGSTLVELLCATAIMGIAVTGILGAMNAMYAGSARNRQATTASVVARDYAEALVLAAAQPGAWCSASYTVVYTPPTGNSVTPSYGACPANNTTTPQFQSVVIVATGANNVTEDLTIVLRKP
jgi:prepilin-type N-terminal cleavage/methylation domain-containing protein